MSKMRNITALEVIYTLQGIYEGLLPSTSAQIYRVGFKQEEVITPKSRIKDLYAVIRRTSAPYKMFHEMTLTQTPLPPATDNISMVYLRDLISETISVILDSEDALERDIGFLNPALIRQIESLLGAMVSVLETEALIYKSIPPISGEENADNQG